MRLEAKAFETMHSPVLITDALGDDMPTVYANPAFEQLTGYFLSEIIGRNCRFLQGADRDQPAIPRIRRALAEKRSIRAVLRNYRKNGEPFINELFIDPIFDETGRVTHFVGCQNLTADAEMIATYNDAMAFFRLLTKREQEIFGLLVTGLTNKEAAKHLEISPRTVETHRSAIYDKANTKKLTSLIRFAIALGFPLNNKDIA